MMTTFVVCMVGTLLVFAVVSLIMVCWLQSSSGIKKCVEALMEATKVDNKTPKDDDKKQIWIDAEEAFRLVIRSRMLATGLFTTSFVVFILVAVIVILNQSSPAAKGQSESAQESKVACQNLCPDDPNTICIYNNGVITRVTVSGQKQPPQAQ